MKEAKVTRFSLYLFLSVLFIFAIHNSYYNSKSELILEKNKEIIPLQEEVQELFDDIDLRYEVVTIEKTGKIAAYVLSIYEETETLPWPLNTTYEFNTNEERPLGKNINYYWESEKEKIYEEESLEIYSIHGIGTDQEDGIIGKYVDDQVNVYFFSVTPHITDHDIDVFKQMFKIDK